jgi:hypothetical protein
MDAPTVNTNENSLDCGFFGDFGGRFCFKYITSIHRNNVLEIAYIE